MIIRYSLCALAVMAAVGITAVSAQKDPVSERRAAMKAVSSQNAVATQMLTGKRPFSMEEAQQVFNTFADSATRMRKLFPADAKAGETKALPAIWEKWDEFEARLVKFADESKAAVGKVKDLASFKQEIGAVRQNCGACHKPFRGT